MKRIRLSDSQFSKHANRVFCRIHLDDDYDYKMDKGTVKKATGLIDKAISALQSKLQDHPKIKKLIKILLKIDMVFRAIYGGLGSAAVLKVITYIKTAKIELNALEKRNVISSLVRSVVLQALNFALFALERKAVKSL